MKLFYATAKGNCHTFVTLDWQHGVQLKYIGLWKFKKVLQLLMCGMITAVKMNDNMWHGFENNGYF